MDDKMALLTKVNNEAEALYKRGTLNHTVDLIFSYGSIIGSAAATVMVGSNLFVNWFTAAIAAVAGVCTGLQRVADYRGRSAWYFLHATDHEVLSHNLEFGNITVQDAAREFGVIKKKWEEAWNLHVKPDVGGPGAPPPAGPGAPPPGGPGAPPPAEPGAPPPAEPGAPAPPPGK